MNALPQTSRRFTPLLGLLFAGLLWWGISAWKWRNDPILVSFSPGPSLQALYQLISSGELWPHLFASLRRVLLGLGVAASIGIPLGLLLGIWPKLDHGTSAIFQFIRMISPLSWMPIAVMLLGLGDLPVIFLISIAAVWPLILNTAAGVRAVDAQRLLLARSLCATRTETVLQIILPSILGPILSGVRIAVGVAWIVLVPAEMLGVRAGLGYYILDTRDRLAYSELVAVILVIGLLGFAFEISLRSLHRRWAPTS